MTNKMISNSDILSSLFNKKQYSFLQEIDKKLDIIEEQKKELIEKENGIKKLFESEEIDSDKKEKVSKCIKKLKYEVKELEVRIKELNQAIIRLVVDKETNFKYQSQDERQTVSFSKDKIEQFMTLEKKFNKELEKVDLKISNILEGKEEKNKKEEIIEKIEETEKSEKKVTLPKRRIRNGSALNEIESLKELNEVKSIEESESKFEAEEKEQEKNYNIENNVLLISEKVGKIFLPYKKEDIQSYLIAYPNDYKNYGEVIEKEYILPLDNFMKNQTLARFREMYDLVRNKEFRSMLEAMKVSTKFMFKYELNPAIIAACNSMEELDKYLNCLEKNKLEEFDIFDIKFELSLL